jgi:hypothetical protein
MQVSSRGVRTAAGLALAAGACLAGGQDVTNPRGELEALAAVIDVAVHRVSQPSLGPLMGSDAPRGYYVSGQGAMIVLPARAVPRAGRVILLRRGVAVPAPVPTHSPEYAELEMLLGPAEAQRVLAQRALEERARREIARSARARRLSSAEREHELRLLEERAEAFQREAERVRREAERALEEIAREVQQRMGAEPESPGTAPRAAPAPSVAQPASATPHVSARPAQPPNLPPVPAPPWRFWFGTDNPEDDRTPERIVAEVREAITAALEANGARLLNVGGEEAVMVAVDFVAGGYFAAGGRPAHTLVVRVRKRALDERAAGKLAPDEFRKQVQYNEY